MEDGFGVVPEGVSGAKRLRLPPWFRRSLPTGAEGPATAKVLKSCGVETVCREARCPNRGHCLSRGTAAFLVLGTVCTRACRFCAIDHGRPPSPPDPDEPRRVAEAARGLGLRYVVVTSVTRDDLPDGGSGHFAAVIRALREKCPGAGVEVLIPDFQGDAGALQIVLDARPDVLNHNLETVRRLQRVVRSKASYETSLEVLARAARAGLRAKSGLMLGLGESADEVREALRDLRTAGVSLVTIGQYLPPSRKHYPLARYVPPEEFAALRAEALAMGFEAVDAGPFVRSSFHADAMVAGERKEC